MPSLLNSGGLGRGPACSSRTSIGRHRRTQQEERIAPRYCSAVEDAAELDRRARQYDGWLAPWNVSLLIEHGHLAEVRRLAEEGDWYCARAWSAALVEQGQRDLALDVLRPFAETGWWDANRVIADLLESWGRVDEALALCRPFAEAEDRLAVVHAAEMLARHGKADDGFELLLPHVADWYPLRSLVGISAGLGRDEELIGLLRPRAQQLPGTWSNDAACAVELLATVLERADRVDEAVAELRGRIASNSSIYVNTFEQLADILLRHERLDEVREVIAGRGGRFAVPRLAQHLARRGAIDAAVEALHAVPEAPDYQPGGHAARILIDAGRIDEGLAAIRNVLDPSHQCVTREWWELMVDHGRADEALAVIDQLAASWDQGMTWELFCERVRLLDHAGREDQAIAELRAHPEVDTWYGAWTLSDLLIGAGKLDEAAAVLEQSFRAGHNTDNMAQLMIRQGNVREAVELLRKPKQSMTTDPWAIQHAPDVSPDVAGADAEVGG
jgi:tetratricopeptide (TPR) repeat protein